MAILLGAVILVAGLAGLYKLYRLRDTAVRTAETTAASRQRHIVEQMGAIPIAMLGDSITARGDWPHLLGNRVVNLGESGSTTIGIQERAAMLPPTVQTVFLMGGINDLKTGATVDDTAHGMENIVALLQPRHVYLESVLLTSDSELNQRVDEVNARLRYLCESGACSFIDLNILIAPTGTLHPEMTVDGTHLQPRAYALWADRISPLVASQTEAARH